MPRNYADSSILIVEDVSFNQMIIADILRNNGYNNLEFASTGKEALEKIKSFTPDVVLLDLILPDMEGLDICKAIKENPNTRDISIIVQSALTKPEHKKKAFEIGANDFVNKPIEQIELASRIKLQLEQKSLNISLRDSNSRMLSELADANKLLIDLLPKNKDIEALEDKFSISVSRYYKSSFELGGDFYNIFEIDDQNFGFYLWDFSGHGVKAAINTIRLHTTINEYHAEHLNSSEFLNKTNQSLAKFNSRAFYATMFYGQINSKTKILSYSYASSPSPILISFKRGEYSLIDCKEFPLGIVESHEYKQEELSIADWDMLLLYSDALIETSDESGKFWPVSEIAKFILSKCNAKSSSEEILNTLLRHFNKEYSAQLVDDLTILLVRF